MKECSTTKKRPRDKARRCPSRNRNDRCGVGVRRRTQPRNRKDGKEGKAKRKDIHGAFSESMEKFFPRQGCGILQEQFVVGLDKLEVSAQTVGPEVVYPYGRYAHQPRK